MARERLLSMDRYSRVWSLAIKARDSIMDSVMAEVSGKVPKMRRAGKLEATHNYEQFQAAATPRLVAEMGDDLDFCIRELHCFRSYENDNLPTGVRWFSTILFGMVMFVVGGFFPVWHF